MSENTDKNKKPAIRFKGFQNSWEQRKVGTFTSVLSASRVHKDEWRTEGVPFYRSSDVVSAFKGNDNERAFISTELYEELIKSSGRLEKNDILITGGGSIGIPYIVPNNEPLYSKDADLIWIKKSAEHNSQYLFAYFTSPGFREYISNISHVGTIAHYTIEQVKDTPVLLPSIAEQSAVGGFFSQLDTLITLHQRKLEKLKSVKKSMLEKMFPKNGSNVPEIRFAGFTAPWEQRKLSEVADKVTEKNVDLAVHETFTNSAEYGVISQRDFFDHDISNAENIGGYYVVRNEDFVYNPRISVTAPVGPVNRNKLGRNGVMSPLYTVFRTHDINTTYLEWFFKSSYWHPFMFFNGDSGARSDRFSIKDAVFFEMPIPTPGLAEQRQIGAYMDKLDNLITLHQHKLEKLQNIKKSMLEKMFV